MSEINVKTEATWRKQCKWNNGENLKASIFAYLFSYTENSIKGKSDHKKQD